MKIATLLLLCLFSFSESYSQTGENDFSPAELDTKTYTLKTRDEPPLKLPFSNITILDARFDSSKLGFFAKRGLFMNTRKLFEVLRIRNGVASGIKQYYTNTHDLDNESKYGLLIVMKKFWVTSSREYSFRKQSQSMLINGNSRIIAKWELYIYKDDKYLPFRRIDTLIESTQSVRQLFKDENAEYYNKESIYSILNSFINHINYSKAIAVFEEKKKKSLEEIVESNNARFNIPVLATQKINNGVFLNFNDFKNNTPTFTDFKEKSVKYSLTRADEYLLDNRDSVITKYWAYATDKYARIGPYGTETIFRSGNTFDFFLKSRVTVPRSQGSIVVGNHYILWSPYQVDMETGEIY